jgi:type IV pilus assembly protein PilA
MVPILGVVAVFGVQAGMPAISLAVIGTFYLATFVVSVMFSKRRLNDLNRSGWWFLLFFIPIVNLLLAIYLVFFPGADGPNNFGVAPVQNSWAVILLAILFPIILVGGIGILAAIAIPQYSDFTQRSKIAGSLAAAQPWKTAIAICVAEQGDLTNALCGTPGINGVPADVGAGELNYVARITTTGAGTITVTSMAVDEDGQALVVVLTPSLTVSGVEWVLSGSVCNAIGRSLNC